MFRKTNTAKANINEGVEFILRGAKKRRSMAIASAKMINAELGFNPKLIAIK